LFELNQSGDGFQILTQVNKPDAFYCIGLIFFSNANSRSYAADKQVPLPLSRASETEPLAQFYKVRLNLLAKKQLKFE